MWIEKEFENFYVCQKLFFSACHTPYQKGDFRELTKNCIGRSLEIRYLSIIQHISEFDVLPHCWVYFDPLDFQTGGPFFHPHPVTKEKWFKSFKCSMKILKVVTLPWGCSFVLWRRSFLEISSQLFDVISSIRTPSEMKLIHQPVKWFEMKVDQDVLDEFSCQLN